MQFTALYRKVPEGYIAFVEELPGASVQEATLTRRSGKAWPRRSSWSLMPTGLCRRSHFKAKTSFESHCC